MMKTTNAGSASLFVAFGLTVALSTYAMCALAAPEFGQSGSVSYASGGVGDDERTQMEKLIPDYPLQLLFAGKGSPNEYLAGVKVRITDKDSKVVVDAVAAGPFFLVKMPAGSYSISADFEGAVKRQSVQIAGGKPQRVVILW